VDEKRMKTPDNMAKVSFLAIQEAGSGVKTDGERGCGSEKQDFGVKKWLAKPSDGRKIAETTRKTQFAP